MESDRAKAVVSIRTFVYPQDWTSREIQDTRIAIHPGREFAHSSRVMQKSHLDVRARLLSIKLTIYKPDLTGWIYNRDASTSFIRCEKPIAAGCACDNTR